MPSLEPEVLACFSHSIVDTADERRTGPAPSPGVRQVTTVQAGTRSSADIEEAFKRGAVAVLGWPLDDPAPKSTGRSTVPTDIQVVMELINGVEREEPVQRLEAILKRDPTLSFKLPRYINSAGFGLGCEVTSFRHAVMILGLKKLFRWAALLLTSIKSGTAPPVVASFAVTRARFMELLAAECLPVEDCDNAFLAGVFSLLDVMLGVPMEQALENIVLPSDINDALIERTGVLAPFLLLVEACEVADGDEVAELSRSLQLSNEQINRAHLEALSWAEQFVEG